MKNLVIVSFIIMAVVMASCGKKVNHAVVQDSATVFNHFITATIHPIGSDEEIFSDKENGFSYKGGKLLIEAEGYIPTITKSADSVYWLYPASLHELMVGPSDFLLPQYSAYYWNAKVIDRDGNPVDSARIVITNMRDFSTVTNSNGTFLFRFPIVPVEDILFRAEGKEKTKVVVIKRGYKTACINFVLPLEDNPAEIMIKKI